ncbi:phosphohistidine phosphatase SixA [Mizugakiibacter sediminis]|uniref:Phosphohistidine phosphatase SixA n=1 Tax=Mizugakiibacter sediminis TaxID=1475481 RepID=A0A0K8QL98_9GAMM|nr:histidine phosphatase family protein [Mizugakiibacter sediminis]GAP65695.1 phosphohistidine phosphatase SixA [Mizugakiibacter sediminis]
MRELILVRHAEAMQSAPDGSDRERPLSLRGEAEAVAAGRWLLDQGAHPAHVLCSPARRAQMTAERLLATLGPLRPRYEPAIYDATPGELLALLDALPQAPQTLLIGHNPGLERLVALLVSGRSVDYRGMPPAAVAWIRIDGALEPGTGRLHRFWSP